MSTKRALDLAREAAGLPPVDNDLREIRRQGADGTPHMAWFDKRTQASFIWDGRSAHIEVSLGGYGEPVDHYIAAPGYGWNHTPLEALTLFEQVVRAYNDTLPDY